METRIATHRGLLFLLGAIALLLCVGLGAGIGSANQGASGHSEASLDGQVAAGNFDKPVSGAPGCWNVVPSPNGSSSSSALTAISALSADDIWAVGVSIDKRLVEHWDGTAWSVSTFQPGSENGRLLAVQAIAPNEVWAVGTGGTNNIVHWDGTTWGEVTGLPEIQAGYLNDISAVSANDIWVVGRVWRSGADVTLALHWNGTQWSVVPTPNASAITNELFAVKAIASDDVWAVGTMMMHWDGTQWNAVTPPDTTGSMEEIDASASNDVWVVGSYFQQSYSVLIWHWDGISWSVVPSPSPGRLFGVTALAPDDVWAVGGYQSEPNRDRTLALHWDGASWTQISTTNPGDAKFNDVVSLSANDIWAVGHYFDATNSNVSTLVERYAAPCPTATPTWTPVTPTATSTPGGPACWSVTISPSQGNLGTLLKSIEIISPDDIWAVGNFGAASQTYTQHWDGTRWETILSTNGGPGNSYLHDVSAAASNDVWAVGTHSETSQVSTALTLHWDGAAWSVVPNPNSGQATRSLLYGVAALSANDVWAVGVSYDTGSGTSIMHWDGTQWSIVPSPSPDVAAQLFDITALAADDIWAVGTSFEGVGGGNAYRPVLMHWDGATWTLVAAPPFTGNSMYVHSASAASPNDVWAVGYQYPSNGGLVTTLTLHWDGQAWSVIGSPSVGTAYDELFAVTAIAANDAWAVGYYTFTLNGPKMPLKLHWDGTAWSVVAPPGNEPVEAVLEAIDSISSSEIWAGGSYPGSNATNTLVEKYSDPCSPPPPPPPPPVSGCWNQIPTADPGQTPARMNAIAVVSANDIWAVGSRGTYALIEHWDGAVWTLALTENIPGNLVAVSASSADNVWAVGSNGRIVTMRWDGEQWSVIPAPVIGEWGDGLTAVAAISASDVWATGSFLNMSYSGPLALHWDGTQWSNAPDPASGGGGRRINSMDAISANDIWAVGYAGGNAAWANHWDGTQWTPQDVPRPSANTPLYDVDALAPDDVWAVGQGLGATMVMHFDGSEWLIMPSPNEGTGTNLLTSVTAISSSDVWAAGSAGDKALLMHWDGSDWTISSNPTASSVSHFLGIAAVSESDVWGVGYYNEGGGALDQALAEHYSLAAFTDVPPDNPFYSQVQCLVCKGIISGYADGTFRPNNDVTRGQLAKIVSNSAGFDEDPGAQIFEDVPPGSTFYDWVQRLANRGHISGYPCGGEGEPCGLDNKPYFRPNATATRGQISKIVSNAAGYDDTPPDQTFEDVPPSNPFYVWVERLASRGIMSGYPCGGEGEPCGPENLPYFRWGNNATRGQTSKIVANTFFPDCQVR